MKEVIKASNAMMASMKLAWHDGVANYKRRNISNGKWRNTMAYTNEMKVNERRK